MTVLSSTAWPDSASPETRPSKDSDSFDDAPRDEIRGQSGEAPMITDDFVESTNEQTHEVSRTVEVDTGYDSNIQKWPAKEVAAPTRFVSPLLVREEDDDDDRDDDDSADADDEKSGFGDDLDDGEDDLDEFDDIDEDDFDDEFDDDFEEELDDDYEIAIDDEISAEFGLNTAGDDLEDEEDDLDDFEDFDAID